MADIEKARRRYRYRYVTDRTFGKRDWLPPFPVAANVSPRRAEDMLPGYGDDGEAA